MWKRHKKGYSYLIVGAGFSGIVMTERLASTGKKILLIDKKTIFEEIRKKK